MADQHPQLTEREITVLQYLADTWKIRGKLPTYSEVQRDCNLTLTVVQSAVRTLTRAGCINRRRRQLHLCELVHTRPLDESHLYTRVDRDRIHAIRAAYRGGVEMVHLVGLTGLPPATIYEVVDKGLEG